MTVSGIAQVLRGKTKAAPGRFTKPPSQRDMIEDWSDSDFQIFRFFFYLQNITLTLFTEIT